MKSDLDQLLRDNQAGALWATGPAQHNPAVVYLTGGGHMTAADVFKKVGEEPVLCHAPMERDEAARTGLKTINFSKFPTKERLALAEGDHLVASALLNKSILEEIGLTSGKVLVYGRTQVGKFYSILKKLEEMLPGLSFEGDINDAVLLQAMATKEVDEIERIQAMGKVVTTVVSRVAAFLTGHTVEDEILIKPDGTPLLILSLIHISEPTRPY